MMLQKYILLRKDAEQELPILNPHLIPKEDLEITNYGYLTSDLIRVGSLNQKFAPIISSEQHPQLKLI